MVKRGLKVTSTSATSDPPVKLSPIKEPMNVKLPTKTSKRRLEDEEEEEDQKIRRERRLENEEREKKISG